MRLGEEDEEDIEAPANAARRRLQQLKEESLQKGDVSSSAVQGNAAEGLLELMNSGRQ